MLALWSKAFLVSDHWHTPEIHQVHLETICVVRYGEGRWTTAWVVQTLQQEWQADLSCLKKKKKLRTDSTLCKPVPSPRRERGRGVWCLFPFNAVVLPSFPKTSAYCQTFMWDRVTRGSFHSSLPGDIRHPPAVSLSLPPCLPTTHPPAGKHCTSLFSHPHLKITP